MPLPLSIPEKFFMLRMNLAPSPMLDMAAGFSFYVILAALRLGLFRGIGEESLTAEEIAARTGTDPGGIEMLLGALEPLGYIKKRRERYSNTRTARKWLLGEAGEQYVQGFEYYCATMSEIWPHLDRSIKKGSPHVPFYRWLGEKPGIASDYQGFMMGLARRAAPGIVGRLKLGSEKILDIGGSHGLYSIGLCEHNKNIHVTVLDSRYAMPLLKKNIRAAGLDKRISPVTGDFMKKNSAKNSMPFCSSTLSMSMASLTTGTWSQKSAPCSTRAAGSSFSKTSSA